MDTTTPAVSPLRQRMIEDMRMRKLEPKTQQAYIRAVLKLSAYLKRSPDTASAEDLRNFQLHLVDSGTSVSARASHLAQLPDSCQIAAVGIQRCGSNSSMRLFGCVGSRSSTSRR
jgi:hypothetical protein